MSAISKKAQFVRHPDPDVFVRSERRKRPWLKHSVAVLILTPQVNQVALVLPKKAADRGADNVRVPPQQGLESTGMVKTVAAEILRELLSSQAQVSRGDLHYLGSALGDGHCGEAVKPYNKWIHWVVVQLPKRGLVFRNDSTRFMKSHWCSANQLLIMKTALAMSERKYFMTLQALVAYNVFLGTEGILTHKAGKELAS